MANRPQDRYANVTVLRRTSGGFQEGRTVPAKEDTLPRGAWKLVNRNIAISTVSAALLLIAVIWGRRRGDRPRGTDQAPRADEERGAGVPGGESRFAVQGKKFDNALAQLNSRMRIDEGRWPCSTTTYWYEYRIAETFGLGDVRGVIAPESSNNAKEGGHLVPTIAFGVPAGASMAILLGAFLMHGLTPGPDMLTKQLDVTYTIVWSLTLAHVIGALICLSCSRWLAQISTVRPEILLPIVLSLVFVAAYEGSHDWGDLYSLMIFGVVGWIMKRLGWPRPPMVLGIVIGGIFERYLYISVKLCGSGGTFGRLIDLPEFAVWHRLADAPGRHHHPGAGRLGAVSAALGNRAQCRCRVEAGRLASVAVFSLGGLHGRDHPVHLRGDRADERLAGRRQAGAADRMPDGADCRLPQPHQRAVRQGAGRPRQCRWRRRNRRPRTGRRPQLRHVGCRGAPSGGIYFLWLAGLDRPHRCGRIHSGHCDFHRCLHAVRLQGTGDACGHLRTWPRHCCAGSCSTSCWPLPGRNPLLGDLFPELALGTGFHLK